MPVIPIMQKYTLEELTIINEMREHKALSIPMNPRVNYQVSRPDPKLPFSGRMTIEIGSMDDDSPLYVKVRIHALLLSAVKKGEDGQFDPQEFHRKSFPIVFDICRTIIASATQIGGMTPILLNPIDPSRLNVEKSSPEG